MDILKFDLNNGEANKSSNMSNFNLTERPHDTTSGKSFFS